MLRSIFRKQWDNIFVKNDYRIKSFGKVAPWHIRTDIIGPQSVVISGGVGNDVSFEIELVETFNCHVHLFDPSPTGRSTMALQTNNINGLTFYPIGLAGKNETISFAEPNNPQEGSFRMAAIGENTQVSFECKTISSFMAGLGICELDILKLDIEGFEFAVLDDIISNKIHVKQICVELHHFLPGFTRLDTIYMISKLLFNNYRIMHKSREDYLFVNKKYI